MKRRLVILATPLLFAGCGGAAPPKPATLDLTVIGSANQNPDAAGTPEPVAVHFYPLAATGKFTTATPYALMGGATALLGADLAGPSDQVIVAPGATVTVKRSLPQGAQSLGVIVLFRSIETAHWRLTVPLKPHAPNPLTLRIDGITAKLTPSVKKG
ncbi:MAG TPA: type VI secretion system lipoprotein TssJ [Acidiphilium sp.]